MKNCILIMISFLCISTYGAIEEPEEKVIATLPEGITVELVGLRNYSIRDLEQFKDGNYQWWRPDGTAMDESPDMSQGRTSVSDSYWFVIRFNKSNDYTCKAVAQLSNNLTVHPVNNKGKGFENDELRFFTLIFAKGQKQADIELGLAIGQWNVVENWSFWYPAAPDDSFFSSNDGVIMRCPEQKGSDVVAEITQTILDDATRLVAYDKKDILHKSQKSGGGTGAGISRYIHRFKNLNIQNIDHLEFQSRPYDYRITFKNVSLQIGQKTQVQVKIKKPGYLLPGEPLPNFDGINIDPARTSIQDKSLLVCFFDMEQRPSRNCILELSQKAQELKSKDIEIIAVQASKIEQEYLDNWAKENNMDFPIGIIKENQEQTLFNWDVKALPWLILTDKEHIVQTEGFSINELDNKIEK
ncbi:MAG: redoxin domain-containing protein [Sedimentisphaerales bacterium]|nr:redoxin domain-containing protein [Sedimentisphaerales bacterium]